MYGIFAYILAQMLWYMKEKYSIHEASGICLEKIDFYAIHVFSERNWRLEREFLTQKITQENEMPHKKNVAYTTSTLCCKYMCNVYTDFFLWSATLTRYPD